MDAVNFITLSLSINIYIYISKPSTFTLYQNHHTKTPGSFLGFPTFDINKTWVAIHWPCEVNSDTAGLLVSGHGVGPPSYGGHRWGGSSPMESHGNVHLSWLGIYRIYRCLIHHPKKLRCFKPLYMYIHSERKVGNSWGWFDTYHFSFCILRSLVGSSIFKHGISVSYIWIPPHISKKPLLSFIQSDLNLSQKPWWSVAFCIFFTSFFNGEPVEATNWVSQLQDAMMENWLISPGTRFHSCPSSHANQPQIDQNSWDVRMLMDVNLPVYRYWSIACSHYGDLNHTALSYIIHWYVLIMMFTQYGDVSHTSWRCGVHMGTPKRSTCSLVI